MDTPGLFDTTMTDQDVKKELAKSMGMTAPGPHIILLTINVGRFTGDDYDAVKNFVKHFGDGIYNYLIVVFTRGDSLKESNISNYVKDSPQSLKDILELCKNRYIGFNNLLSGKSRDQQVEQLLAKANEVLQEIPENQSSYYTNEMYEEAKKRRLEIEKQMKEINLQHRQLEDERQKMEVEALKHGSLETEKQQKEDYHRTRHIAYLKAEEEFRKRRERYRKGQCLIQ